MTVSSNLAKAGPYSCNGVQTVFPFAFKCFDKADLLVVHTDAAGLDTTLVVDSTFTVILNADQDAAPGGTITTSTAYASGHRITIGSDIDATQGADITNFRPDVIERALDKLTLLVQQVRESAGRTLKIPFSSPVASEAVLPTAEPFKLLGWNSDGTGFANYGAADAGVLSGQLAVGSGSDLVGHDGLGSVAKTIGETVTDIAVSVKNFPNVQAAIDAVAALNPNGGLVFLPKGNYADSGTWTITTHGIRIKGQGKGATQVMFTNGAADSIFFNGRPIGGFGIYNCSVEDMTINHSGKTGGIAIRHDKSNNSEIKNVNVYNCWNGVDYKTVNNPVMEDVLMANVRGAYGCKFWSLADGTERSDVLTMRNVLINNNLNGGDGLVWDGFAHTLRCISVGIISARYGLVVKNSGASSAYYPVFGMFTDLEIDATTGTAVRLEAGSVFNFVGCDLVNLPTSTGPVFEVLADSGAGGSFTSDIRITGGRIFGGNKEAIVMAGRNFQLGGSALVGGGDSTGYPCIRIANGAQDFSITDTTVGNSWGYLIDKYTHGVHIEATTYRGYVGENSYYGCLAEVNNLSNTGTVRVGSYINRSGVPNEPNSIIRRNDNNTGTFEDRMLTTSVGASVSAARSLQTGTVNSFTQEALLDNSGAPYRRVSGGSAVTTTYQDFNVHVFRNAAGTQQFAIGQALPNYANDAAAAAGGVPLNGYYRNGNVVNQRLA